MERESGWGEAQLGQNILPGCQIQRVLRGAYTLPTEAYTGAVVLYPSLPRITAEGSRGGGDTSLKPGAWPCPVVTPHAA